MSPRADAAEQSVGTSPELQSILEHRRRAQEAVDEQERKLAELTSLQTALRSRLNELEQAQDEDEEEPLAAELDEDDDEESDEVDEDMALKLLDNIRDKTSECPSTPPRLLRPAPMHHGPAAGDRLTCRYFGCCRCEKLANVIEDAREAGMDAENPRLLAAERNLATRYSEVKELAGIADKLGLQVHEEEEGEEEGEEEEEFDQPVRVNFSPRNLPPPPPRPHALLFCTFFRCVLSRTGAQTPHRLDMRSSHSMPPKLVLRMLFLARLCVCHWLPLLSQETMLRAQSDEAAASAQTALRNVHRLEQELENCIEQLRLIDGSTSDAVARHPAFLRMRASVQQKMVRRPPFRHTSFGA